MEERKIKEVEEEKNKACEIKVSICVRVYSTT